MNTSFTPGPWTIRYERYNRYVLCSPCHPGGLGHFAGWSADDVTTVDQDEANARLIAASPELLLALQDCLESLKRMPDADGAFKTTCMVQAAKAINLATEQ